MNTENLYSVFNLGVILGPRQLDGTAAVRSGGGLRPNKILVMRNSAMELAFFQLVDLGHAEED
jgi:hypothetical protein